MRPGVWGAEVLKLCHAGVLTGRTYPAIVRALVAMLEAAGAGREGAALSWESIAQAAGVSRSSVARFQTDLETLGVVMLDRFEGQGTVKVRNGKPYRELPPNRWWSWFTLGAFTRFVQGFDTGENPSTVGKSVNGGPVRTRVRTVSNPWKWDGLGLAKVTNMAPRDGSPKPHRPWVAAALAAMRRGEPLQPALLETMRAYR